MLARGRRWGMVIGIVLLAGTSQAYLARNYVVISPGPAESLATMVRVEGGVRDAKGDFLLTAVTSRPASLASCVAAAVSPVVDLVPRSQEIPRGMDTNKYLKIMEGMMRESEVVAGAVALRKLGYEVHVETVVRIEEVLKDSPAQGLLEEGDVILAVDGQPVGTAEEVVKRIGARHPGTPVDLTILRGGRTLDFTVPTVPHPEDRTQAAVGVLVSPSVTEDLPVEITINPHEIKGSSAGLMFTLEILDQLDPRDLTAGQTIAGTGTISLDGTVGPVGGVKQKVAAAERAGARYFLVPAENARAAREAATRLEVIPVRDIDEALHALDKIARRGNGTVGE
ncbi:MAG TPA: PDZ domain-containing protein [Firmicutes bacterium]|nr:PDZ domain-containing protein [Bacillota bacterium]